MSTAGRARVFTTVLTKSTGARCRLPGAPGWAFRAGERPPPRAMASVTVNNIRVLNNPAPFRTPLKFEITFEAHVALQEDLDWTVTYVGSGDNQEHDQVLESVSVGPFEAGTSRFTLETPAPDAARIPPADLLGSTICFVSCAYRGQEFVRVGYWVSNAYSEPLAEGEEPPMPCPTDKIVRTILDERPRVTKWTIQWE